MKIALTGAAGFLSKNLLKHLDKYYDIDCFDFSGNSRSPFSLLEALYNSNSHDLVIHLGANSNAQIKHRSENIFNNTSYSNSLATLCAKRNVPFLFASSFAVYGSSSYDLELSPYAQSKLKTEEYLCEIGPHFPDWRFLAMRLTNLYGMFEDDKGDMKSIPVRFIQDARHTRIIEVWENVDYTPGKTAMRDFLYVEDFCHILLSLIKSQNWKQEIMDVGSGISTSLLEVAEFVQGLIPSKIELIPVPKHVNIENYQMHTQADLRKLREFIPDFQPTPLREAIKVLAERL